MIKKWWFRQAKKWNRIVKPRQLQTRNTALIFLIQSWRFGHTLNLVWKSLSLGNVEIQSKRCGHRIYINERFVNVWEFFTRTNFLNKWFVVQKMCSQQSFIWRNGPRLAWFHYTPSIFRLPKSNFFNRKITQQKNLQNNSNMFGVKRWSSCSCVRTHTFI